MNFYGISKFTAKITKRSLLTLFIRVYCYANNPLELLLLLTRGPWPVGKNRGRLRRPLPATRLAGGEGDVGVKWRGGRAAPPGVLGATGKGRRRWFRGGGQPAAEGIDGEGAPVDDGRREAVRELIGSEAKLAGVSS